MTRQRKYQLRRLLEGNCPLCGKPKGKTQLCEMHRVMSNQSNSERKKSNVRKVAADS